MTCILHLFARGLGAAFAKLFDKRGLVRVLLAHANRPVLVVVGHVHGVVGAVRVRDGIVHLRQRPHFGKVVAAKRGPAQVVVRVDFFDVVHHRLNPCLLCLHIKTLRNIDLAKGEKKRKRRTQEERIRKNKKEEKKERKKKRMNE